MRQAIDSIGSGTHQLHRSTKSSRHGDAPETETQLSGVLPEARFFGASDIAIHSCVDADAGPDHTATVGEGPWSGKLVVYRIGTVDPMRVVADAMACGAAGILTEQLLPCPVPQCIVADVETAVAKIETSLLGRPDRKLLTIGILGTAGKTTTSLLVSSVLRRAGIRTAYQNDLGESDGVIQTTPDHAPPTNGPLVRWLGDAVDADSQAAVIELSEKELRNGHYDAIEFDVLIMTGSTHPTSDFGPAALESAIERLTKDGVVIAPADDKVGSRVVLDAGLRVVTYGIRQAADVTAKIIDQSGGMTTLLVNYDDTTLAMETSLCGSAMAANHLAAISLGVLIDLPLHVTTESVASVQSLPGRLQSIGQLTAADTILDVARSPQQITSALRTARSMRGSGKLWCVMSIDATHDDSDLAQIGHVMERFADQAIVTATPASKPTFLKRSHEVLDGVEECAAFRMVADQTRAIQWALSEAKSQDTVLLLVGNDANPRAQRERIESLVKEVTAASENHADRPAFRIVRAD